MLSSIKSRFDKLREIRLDCNLDSLSACDFLLMTHDSGRPFQVDSKPYATLIDSVREDLEARGYVCRVVAHPFSKLIGEKACGNPISINRPYFFAKIGETIRCLCNRYLGMQLDTQLPLVKLFTAVIRQSQAKAIIATHSLKALSIAAKKQGTHCVELLHGMGYPQVTLAGTNRDSNSMPAAVLCFDITSKKTFAQLHQYGTKVFHIPHPFLKAFSQQPERFSSPDLPTYLNNKKVILFALQWGFDGSMDTLNGILNNGLYPQVLHQIFEHTRDDIIWGFRLHPLQQTAHRYIKHQQMIERLCQQFFNVEWQWFSQAPLLQVLQHCSGVMTMFSMVVYEATLLGIPALALSPTLQPKGIHHDYFAELVDAGSVQKQSIAYDGILQWSQQCQPRAPSDAIMGTEEAWQQAIHWMTMPKNYA